MNKRFFITGLSIAAILLAGQFEASAQLNKLLIKAKDNAHRIENAVNNSQKRAEAAAALEADALEAAKEAAEAEAPATEEATTEAAAEETAAE